MAKAPTPVLSLPRRLAKKAKAFLPGADSDRGQDIANPRRNLLQQSIRTIRDTGQTTEAIRRLSRSEGAMSFSVFAYVQVAMSGHRVQAFDSATHTYSPEGTRLARAVISQIDTLHDYSKGFNDKDTIDQVVETALREVVLTGGLAAELVLDQTRLPNRLNVIARDSLNWKSKGKGTNDKYPVQTGFAGGEIDLDIPTFFMAESHLEASQAYPTSMMEAALNMIFYHEEFIEDIRRVVRKSGHPRTIATLNTEAVRASAPAEARNDEVKMRSYMESVRDAMQTLLQAVEPEDAIVTYDAMSVDNLKSEGEKSDYTELMNTISGQAAVSLKSHPSILGMRMAGSQSLSNTESLIYLKIARAIQVPVESVMSRAITLAVRLFGADVYVRFRFNPINLRPQDELEAFSTMREDRLLRRLSLGLISDEDAAEQLGIGELPPGFETLSGTHFMDKTPTQDKQPSPNSDPQGRALQSPTPKKAGGRSQ